MRRLLATLFVSAALAATAVASDDFITLPTGWQIATAPAAVATLGTLPSGIVLSRDGSRAFVVESGHEPPALRIIDTRTLTTLRQIVLPSASGAPVRDPAGDGVWVANSSAFGAQIAHIDTASARVDRTFSLPAGFAPSAVAITVDGARLAVTGDLADRVAVLDAHSGRTLMNAATGHHPAAAVWDRSGRLVTVANRGADTLTVLDTRRGTTRTVQSGLHPAALAIDAHDRIYAADSDDDDVAVVDGNRVVARVRVPWGERGLTGASPNGLAIDGDRLYVSCGAANAIAVFRRVPAGLEPAGALTAGWYPTGVAATATSLLVLDGKGEGGHANVRFRPGSGGTNRDYVADNITGSLRAIARPSDAVLQAQLAIVRRLVAPDPDPSLRSAMLSPAGPIKHVIYIIKENRTYDQVLGDVAMGDGDPSLVMYGEDVTPNEHALARRFGLFDRFFEDAHVSADGHNWSTAAFANDYLEHMWPANYAGRRPLYDFEDGAEAARPHGGYLWDAAADRGRSVRDYGEFVTNGANDGDTPVSTTFDVLRPFVDPRYPSFDLDISDQARFMEWNREFQAYEAANALPALEIVRLPNDHTAGTKSGKPTPRAMVADNDLALGNIVSAVSHSRDWRSTAIFVVEDDAQDGPDHVDEQRSTFFLISPYATGGLHHERLSQAGVLHTIEALLGLRALSPYDAKARTLGFALGATPDLTPFDAIPAHVDLREKNAAATTASDRFDLRAADRVDPALMNDALWRAARGAGATPPPYGAFSRT